MTAKLLSLIDDEGFSSTSEKKGIVDRPALMMQKSAVSKAGRLLLEMNDEKAKA